MPEKRPLGALCCETAASDESLRKKLATTLQRNSRKKIRYFTPVDFWTPAVAGQGLG